jgi:hypothetical protein
MICPTAKVEFWEGIDRSLGALLDRQITFVSRAYYSVWPVLFLQPRVSGRPDARFVSEATRRLPDGQNGTTCQIQTCAIALP